MKKRTQHVLIEASGSQDADRAVGGQHAVFSGQPEEGSPLGSHGMHLRPAPSACGPGGPQAPPRLEGIAHAVHPAVLRGAEQGSQHAGKGVDMFVRVDVADGEAARLDALYLGDGLGLNLLLADAAAQQITQKTPHRGTERWRSRSFAGRAAKALRRGGGSGEPSTRTTWQPTASAGWAKAR